MVDYLVFDVIETYKELICWSLYMFLKIPNLLFLQV
jgi:hypothetical protein